MLLADGSVYEGYSFRAKGTVIGEIVFSTGMTGYQETLTDPSYYGQLSLRRFLLWGITAPTALTVSPPAAT